MLTTECVGDEIYYSLASGNNIQKMSLTSRHLNVTLTMSMAPTLLSPKCTEVNCMSKHATVSHGSLVIVLVGSHK